MSPQRLPKRTLTAPAVSQDNEAPIAAVLFRADNLHAGFNVAAVWIMSSSTDLRTAKAGVHKSVKLRKGRI